MGALTTIQFQASAVCGIILSCQYTYGPLHLFRAPLIYICHTIEFLPTHFRQTMFGHLPNGNEVVFSLAKNTFVILMLASRFLHPKLYNFISSSPVKRTRASTNKDSQGCLVRKLHYNDLVGGGHDKQEGVKNRILLDTYVHVIFVTEFHC